MGIKIKSYVSKNMLMENTYVVTDEDTGSSILIDPGVYSDAIRDSIRSAGRLEYIVLTHAHGDHILALPQYRNEFPEAKLVAHFFEKELLNEPEYNHSGDIGGAEISEEADIYVSESDELSFGNSKMSFIHTPGHTPGSMCIRIGDDLFSGDTLFLLGVGRTDLYKGSWKDIRASIKDKLFELPPYTMVYCGHGLTTSIGDEKRSNPCV